MATADLDRLDGIYARAKKRKEIRDRKRRAMPVKQLWDGDWTLRGVIRGEYAGGLDHVRNDTGQAHIELPLRHHLAVWAVEQRHQGTHRNIHLTVDKDGSRWSGRCSDVTATVDDDGGSVTITFLSDIEELKHILCWPNPFSAAAVQLPRVWGTAMPAITAIKLTAMCNLMRLNGNFYSMPDDPLNWASWWQTINFREWPIIVKPGSLLLDDSPWTILQARFDTLFDLTKDEVEDSELMWDLRRWLPGDPQPWPGAGLYRAGQLVIDLVDKSGWWGQTALGGTIAGGAIREVLEIADDLVEDTRAATGVITNPAEYAVSGFLGVAPSSPWVVYRNDGAPGGVRTCDEVSVSWKPATVAQVVTGGTSMPGVEEAFEATIQTIGSVAANFLMLPNLAEPALTLFEPMIKDTILAFMAYKSLFRPRQMGWSHYLEDWGGETQGYTLSGILATRQAMRKTRDKVTVTAKIHDGGPYLIGDRGEGHFFLGDRVGIQDPVSRGGRVIIAQVSKLSLEWAWNKPMEWDITIGELTHDHDPVTDVTDKTKKLATLLKEAGLA